MSPEGLEPVKYGLSGMEGAAEYFMTDGELVLSGAMDNRGLSGWSLRAAEPKESFTRSSPGSYRHLEYAGESFSLFSEYEAGGRIKRFLITDSDGNELTFFAGKTA